MTTPAKVSPILLRVEGLSVGVDRGSSTDVLYEDLSFDVSPGEVVALTGENGAGKSTLGRVLSGLLRAPLKVLAGQVLFEGRDLLSLSDRDINRLRRSSIKLMLQEGVSALDPVETVGWQLHSLLRGLGIKDEGVRQARIRSMLDDLGLPDERVLEATSAELSGGMGKRIVIAETLLCEPQLIVADEITAGLDLIRAREAVDLLVTRARERNCGVIMISHDPETVARVADKVLRLTRPVAATAGSASSV
jgi:ABC-type glutathione transport system ATPase component